MSGTVTRLASATLGTVLLTSAALVGGSAAVSAADKIPTSIQIMSTMREGAQQPVLGRLTPDRTGSMVTVKYFKRVDGAWVRKATRHAEVGAGDAPGPDFYFVQFQGLAKGKCKLVAKYAGDAGYAASSTSRVIDCKNGM